VITGMHVILFSRHAKEVQKFLGDVLELPSVDAGEGWPIFAAPPAEIGVHETDGEPGHEIYLMCDDINATVKNLAGRGVGTDGPVTEQRWGLVTTLILPGGERLGLYEPRHPSPLL
jgi:hypothetical protein